MTIDFLQTMNMDRDMKFEHTSFKSKSKHFIDRDLAWAVMGHLKSGVTRGLKEVFLTTPALRNLHMIRGQSTRRDRQK